MTSQELIAALDAMGEEPTPYSGRGMNGRYCVGVSVEYRSDAFRLGYDLASRFAAQGDSPEAMDPGTPDMDAMGMMGVVLYWPNMPWPK